jgi:rubrerythrin
MELGTAGSILAFAIKLEGKSAEFYEEAASLAKDSARMEVFLSLAEAKRKRKKLVERSRREYVNEMLLEPIEGLQGSDYLVETELSSKTDYSAAWRLAMELEENSRRLYLDAAELITLPQVARVLRKLGQENADHRLRLQSLHESAGPGHEFPL